jgi:ribosomal protein S18 acetylase RimI-like enzyme
MPSEIHIRDLTQDDIPQVMLISKVEFGTDYQTESDFEDMISSPDRFCRVAVKDDQVLGMASCIVFGPDKLDSIMRLPDSKDRAELLEYRKIGLLEGIAVRNDAKGKGAGTLMAESCRRELISRGTEVMVAMAWKSVTGTINIKPLAENHFHMTPSLEIAGYWNGQVSSPEGHHCPVCGAPCKCSAVLYKMHIR